MYKTKYINKIDFQLCSPSVESNSIFMEFLDENEDVFMMITIDDNNIRHLEIFHSAENLEIPLEYIEKGIEIAKREVRNIDPSDLE